MKQLVSLEYRITSRELADVVKNVPNGGKIILGPNTPAECKASDPPRNRTRGIMDGGAWFVNLFGQYNQETPTGNSSLAEFLARQIERKDGIPGGSNDGTGFPMPAAPAPTKGTSEKQFVPDPASQLISLQKPMNRLLDEGRPLDAELLALVKNVKIPGPDGGKAVSTAEVLMKAKKDLDDVVRDALKHMQDFIKGFGPEDLQVASRRLIEQAGLLRGTVEAFKGEKTETLKKMVEKLADTAVEERDNMETTLRRIITENTGRVNTVEEENGSEKPAQAKGYMLADYEPAENTVAGGVNSEVDAKVMAAKAKQEYLSTFGGVPVLLSVSRIDDCEFAEDK